MGAIDFVKWDPAAPPKGIPEESQKSDPGASPLYAYRFPATNLSTFTQLIVYESQEAVLFSKGRIMGKFGPGKYTLNTENLPMLQSLFGIPFGMNNPFTAEVWYVNKLMPLDIDWETDNMRFHDPDYQTMVPLMAKGRYGLQVVDAERFLVKLVGMATEFTAAKLTAHFQGALTSRTKSLLLQTMQSQRIGVKSIGAYLETLSKTLEAGMAAFWEDYGFKLIALYITAVDIDERTEDGKQILKAMAQQSAQSIAGYTWQQGQSFEVAEKALTSGSDMGMLGVMLMAGGMMGGPGSVGSSMMQPQPPSATLAPGASGEWGAKPPVPRDVFCSHCSKKFESTARFCPFCGDPYTPCPRCGIDNDTKATRCVSCGLLFGPQAAPSATTLKCTRCNGPLAPKAPFCPSCGLKAP